MRTVEDEAGDRYLLLKRSETASLVRDPETGEEAHVENDRLATVNGESPLETAARAVSDSVRRVLTATANERALGLLVELDRQPRTVRDILAATDLCESDLHGLLAEFRAAGLLAECEIAGERGYETTQTANEALEHLSG